MRKYLFILLLLCSLSPLAAQSYYAGLGIAVAQTNTRLDSINQSLDSYERFLENNFANDPLVSSARLENTRLQVFPTFTAGIRLSGLLAGVQVQHVRSSQTADFLRTSGYGRSFEFKDSRTDIMADLGYTAERWEIFGSLGSNFHTNKIISRQIYPSGLRSLSENFYFNGVFEVFDVGLNAGFGLRGKFGRFLTVEGRYTFSGSSLPGGGDASDGTAYTDNSDPDLSVYPAFTKDFSRTPSPSNELYPDQTRSYFILSLIFELRSND